MSAAAPRSLVAAVVPLVLVAAGAAAQEVRPPAVAGEFYPASAGALRAAVDELLAAAPPRQGPAPVALIVPHAGYVFSGQVAADAFRQAEGEEYETVVILGPNHTDPTFDRVGLYRGRAFRTPLGEVAIDEALAGAIVAADRDAVWHNRVHAREHAIEVLLPFVQRLFPRSTFVPIVLGTADPEVCTRLGRTLARLVEGRRALVVASSDLAHYPRAADARRVDRETLEAILSFDAWRVRETLARHLAHGTPGVVTGACGEGPILAVLAAARALGATSGRVVSYATSADSPAGDPARVVGYGAVALTRDQTDRTGLSIDQRAFDGAAAAEAGGALTSAERRALVSYARETIRRFVTTGTAPLARGAPPRLERWQGVFVTLRRDGALRGCVGRLLPDGPLYWLTGAMALQAATKDPRFPPVRARELSGLTIEVSLLTPLREVASPEEIRLGQDGVVLVKDGRSAVFLPEVPVEQGWSRGELLEALCAKADLGRGCWRKGARLAVFQTDVIRERDLR
jgi:AmmeMemoRadiSam system protein B/AmmeMemoRadiSam system protein A